MQGLATAYVLVSGVETGSHGFAAVLAPGVSITDLSRESLRSLPGDTIARVPLRGDGEHVLEGLPPGMQTICVLASMTDPANDAEETPEDLVFDSAMVTIPEEGEVEIQLSPR